MMTLFGKTGLCALAALALPLAATASERAGQSAPQRIEIVLANFSFTPADLRLSADRPVTLHFVNRGSGGHNFVAREFFAAAAMDDATRSSLGKKGLVELAKGESMDVTLTPKAGSYSVQCTHFLHAGFGMTGTISVR